MHFCLAAEEENILLNHCMAAWYLPSDWFRSKPEFTQWGMTTAELYFSHESLSRITVVIPKTLHQHRKLGRKLK